MTVVGVLALAFVLGSVPFSQLASRLVAGVDLRQVGGGTVSGTALYRVAGFGPLMVAGILDVAKGAAGSLVAGPDRPALAAIAGGTAVVGHNWSPWLRGAGGRGISPALGALAVVAWPGAVLLLGSLVAGRMLRQTGLATFAALVALVPLVALTHGRTGALAGGVIVGPMMLKRVLGNRRPARSGAGAWGHRLLFDRDRDDGARAWRGD